MAILPEGKLRNVRASVFKFIETNYTETPVDYAGRAFDESKVKQWVRADLIVSTNKFFRQVGEGQFGADLVLMCNLNIFVHRTEIEGSANIYRVTDLRDLLCELFKVPRGIPVRDYADTQNPIGVCRTYDLDDVDLGLDPVKQLYGYNVTSTMFYLSKWEI